MTDIETMIADAERHGRDSEPDHEVGDLQTLARALWDALTPDARARVTGAWRAWDHEDATPGRSVEAVIGVLVLRAAVSERPGYAGPVSMTCCDGCPGWAVFSTDRGLEIQACDECNALAPDADRLTDGEVAQLPEAQDALRAAIAESLPGCPRCGHALRLCSDNDPACAHCDHCDWCGDPGE